MSTESVSAPVGLVNNAGITGPVRDLHDYTADASPKRSH